MACYFRFLLDVNVDVNAPLSCGRPGCEFFEDSVPSGWDHFIDGCPGCGHGYMTDEEIQTAYHKAQFPNLCSRCGSRYANDLDDRCVSELCPKCEEKDLLQAIRKDLIEFENEQIRLENEQRARGEEDIPL